MLNDDKTEFIIIGTQQLAKVDVDDKLYGWEIITLTSQNQSGT
jgi:hypothetical protein